MSSLEVKYAYIVTSSDGYSNLINGFIQSSEKFTNLECGFYFALENDVMQSYNNYIFITTGGKNWSQRLYKTLLSIIADYIIVIPEDFYFMHTVDSEEIDKIVEYAFQNNIDYIDFSGKISDDFRFSETNNKVDYFKFVSRSNLVPYIVSACGIYKKTFLRDVLRRISFSAFRLSIILSFSLSCSV